MGTFFSVVAACLLLFTGLVGILIFVSPILLCLTLCKSIVTGQFYANLNGDAGIKGEEAEA